MSFALLKPIIKQIFDAIVVPELTALIAKIPNADVDAILTAVNGAIDAKLDALLS